MRAKPHATVVAFLFLSGALSSQTLLGDPRPGPRGSHPSQYAAIDGAALFLARDVPAYGDEVWRTDGTPPAGGGTFPF